MQTEDIDKQKSKSEARRQSSQHQVEQLIKNVQDPEESMCYTPAKKSW